VVGSVIPLIHRLFVHLAAINALLAGSLAGFTDYLGDLGPVVSLSPKPRENGV
jgi:hypothetical protein